MDKLLCLLEKYVKHILKMKKGKNFGERRKTGVQKMYTPVF